VVFDDDPDRIHYDGGSLHYVGVPILRNFHQRRSDASSEIAEVDVFQSVACLLDRDRVLSVGGYDPRYFFYGEDTDLALRLRLRGYRILAVPQALVRHGHGTPGLSQRGQTYPPIRIFLLSRNRTFLWLKLYHRRTLALAAPGILLFELAWCLFATLQGGLGAYLRGKIAVRPHWKSLLEERRSLQANRQLPDRKLLRAANLTFLPHLRRKRGRRALEWLLNRLLQAWWLLIRGWIP